MKTYLLDTNVLIALSWRGHAEHERVSKWFARQGANGWATCPITQAGFVRIVSSPAFSRQAASPQEALQLLKQNLAHPKHKFWPADLDLVEATKLITDRIVGHQQVTDAYLLGLAIKKQGTLATLDRGILELLGARSPQQENLELLA